MITISKTELNKLSVDDKVTKKPKPEKKPDYSNEIKNITTAILKLSEQEQQDLLPILKSITDINSSQQEIIEKLANNDPPPREWEFAVKRDKKGNIEKILAKGT